MCALSAVSSSFSLPYASLRYWISLASRVVGSAGHDGTGSPSTKNRLSASQFPPGRSSTLPSDLVGVAQLVELLVVVQAVGGSSPLAHPREGPAEAGLFLARGTGR